jgi:hypothetical protein
VWGVPIQPLDKAQALKTAVCARLGPAGICTLDLVDAALSDPANKANAVASQENCLGVDRSDLRGSIALRKRMRISRGEIVLHRDASDVVRAGFRGSVAANCTARTGELPYCITGVCVVYSNFFRFLPYNQFGQCTRAKYRRINTAR